MGIGINSELTNEIIRFARAHNIKEVILFGSRARGDNRERSDIDLAVRGGDVLSFRYSLNESSRTLLKFDVVDLDWNIKPEFRQSIEKDGVLLYEKT